MKKINFYFSNINSLATFNLALFSIFNLFKKPCDTFKNKFQNNFKLIFGIEHAILVPSARSGIYAVLNSFDLNRGDEVIVTGFTCSAVIEPIIKNNLIPIYIDINWETYTIDSVAIEKSITTSTKVVILQHTFGFKAKLSTKLLSILKDRNILIIEDCSLALFSKDVENIYLGSEADISIWSFELSKTISVGWGGLIGINKNNILANKVALLLKNAGYQNKFKSTKRLFQTSLSGLLYSSNSPKFIRKYFIEGFFYFKIFFKSSDTPCNNLQMPSDFQWQILDLQLKSFSEYSNLNLNVTKKYISTLKNFGINYDELNTYMIRFPLLISNPQKMLNYFSEFDIEIGRWFSKPISSSLVSSESFNYKLGSCPVAEKVCKHIVNLPTNSKLRVKDIQNINNLLSIYLKNNPNEVEFLLKVYNRKEFMLI